MGLTEIPIWAGYTIWHSMVKRYMEVNPKVRPARLVGLSGTAIYSALSGNAPLAAARRNGSG